MQALAERRRFTQRSDACALSDLDLGERQAFWWGFGDEDALGGGWGQAQALPTAPHQYPPRCALVNFYLRAARQAHQGQLGEQRGGLILNVDDAAETMHRPTRQRDAFLAGQFPGAGRDRVAMGVEARIAELPLQRINLIRRRQVFAAHGFVV